MKKRLLHRRNGASLVLSLILHVILLIALAIFLHQEKKEQNLSSLQVDIIAVKKQNPKRKLRRIKEVESINARENIYDDNPSKAPILRPKLMALDIPAQNADSNLPALHAYSSMYSDDLQSAEDGNKRFSSLVKSARRSKGTGGIMPRRGVMEHPTNVSKREVKAGSGVGGAMMLIANRISGGNSDKEDIVFLVDASGSMEEHIAAVANYLSQMADELTQKGVDCTFGIIEFKRLDRKNLVEILQQTKDVELCKKTLRNIKCSGDERALDAIAVGLSKVKFRTDSQRTFVLVTDEKLMGKYSVEDIAQKCNAAGVKVSVIGKDDKLSKELASQTNGLWFHVPK